MTSFRSLTMMAISAVMISAPVARGESPTLRPVTSPKFVPDDAIAIVGDELGMRPLKRTTFRNFLDGLSNTVLKQPAR